MKRSAFVGLCILLWHVSLAQNAANDWIDYDASRRYFRLSTAQDGLVRIPFSALDFAFQSAGISTGSVDPRSIQVFGRGEEQYIHIEGQSDGSIDAGDYIEFYAQRNDGWLDSSLYIPNELQTNPYYSLYNDTASYFLTWYTDGTFSDRRYETVEFTGPVANTAEYVLTTHYYFYSTSVNSYEYYKGDDVGGGKSRTEYHGGKGWMGNRYGYNGSSVNGFNPVNFNTPNPFTGTGAPNGELEIALSGVNNGAGTTVNAHHTRVILNSGANSITLDDLLYDSYEYDRYSFDIDPNLLGSQTNVRLTTTQSISPITAIADFSACAYMRLTYPMQLVFSAESTAEFEVPQSNVALYFNGSNFSTSPTSYLYDLGLHKRYEVQHSTSTGNVATNIEAGSRRHLILQTNASITSLSQGDLLPVNGSGRFADLPSFEVDSAYVIVTHKSLLNAANAYAAYRDGAYNTIVLDIEELYHQFAYGVRKHPIAIRNLVKYIIDDWSTPPSYLFLIGKGIEEPTMRRNSNYAARSLVPSMGFPVSDALITSGLNGYPIRAPGVPIGRIAARSSSEVLDYLNKVRLFEQSQDQVLNPYTIENRQWQKRILHFAGGDNAAQNQTFKSYLGGYQFYAEDSLFGAQTIVFSKTTGEVFEQIDSDSLTTLLSEGSAVMTFFGHASGNSFDISVDDPENWNNPGRFPLVIANSCFSGNIHLPIDATRSISEDYVFTPNEGAIGFLATPDLSLESALNNYTREFYKQLSRDHYGQSIGRQMRATSVGLTDGLQNRGVALEMTFHGDPALKIYPHDRTELTVNDPKLGAQIKLVPKRVTTDLDSFDVEIHLQNLGRATDRAFNITVTRSFPNGAEDVFETRLVQGINFDEVLTFTFATDAINGVGENRLEVLVDLPISQVDEFIETSNNTIASAQFFISSSDVFPVFPYDFAVVPDFDVVLRANTGFPLLKEETYVLQIDSNDLYNSDFMLEQEITQASAVLEWDPQLETFGFEDSTVFFWRVAPKSDLSKWQEHSFQVVSDQTGWGQAHFFQYKANDFDLLEYDRPTRRLLFPEASRELRVQVVGNPVLGKEDDDCFYKLDGQGAPLGEWGIASTRPTLAVVVIDSVYLKPWGTYGIGLSGTYENEDKRFNNQNDGNGHRTRVEYFFTFELTGSTAATQWAGMVDMITNHVGDGDYLLIYTMNRGLFDSASIWTEAKLSFMESLGADSIRHVGNNNPYIFLVKKGSLETAKQRIGTSSKDIIELRSTLYSNFRLGSMEGPHIGPAMQWGEFHLASNALESPTEDSLYCAFRSIDFQQNLVGVDTLFAEGTTLLNGVNATEFPYADLRFYTEDNANATPGQLRSWHVLYTPAPDAAINPLKGATTTSSVEVNAGVPFNFGLAIENVSAYDFGSFNVVYQLIDGQGEVIEQETLTYASLASEQVIFDSVSFASVSLSGRYTLSMEVNPKGEDWHFEQYHFNNRAFVPVNIKADRQKPLLDVTFDGVHILDGDIVSPTPEIVMELKDENSFLLMDDTTSFDVFLTQGTGQQQRIPFVRNGVQVMAFEGATDAQNKARLTYRPQEALQDGEYKLNVMGRDASGNASGQDAYEINFKVINHSAVTHVMNYPNPFTTSTKFVFTLTGATLPDVFTIQILTVSGKVIREITKDELGPIHIGRNITEYAWDGTDEYGDRLANGVYLYRVIMKIEGEKIDRLHSGADNYFTKEFGKMYLFR